MNVEGRCEMPLIPRRLQSTSPLLFLCALAFLAAATAVSLCWQAPLAHAAPLAAGASVGTAQVSTAKASSGSLNVKKYAIQATLDTGEDHLDLTVTATIKNNSKKALSTLYFRNMASTMIANAKKAASVSRFTKSKITQVTNMTTKKKLKFSVRKADKSIVKVKLGKNKLKPGKTIKIRLKVATDVPEWDGRFGFHELSKGKVYKLAWCFPYLADYRNGAWSLSPLPKIGENRFARTAKYDVTFKAPKKYKVAASGASTTKKGTTRVKTKGLRDFALIVSNLMKKDTATVRGIKIVNWYLPCAYSSKYRTETMLPIKDAVAYMTDHVGVCPFKEIDVCQVFGGLGNESTGSMEYPGLLTVSGDDYYYATNRVKMGAGTATRSTYHEVVHQWFYAAVGNDEFAEPWLDEGIACYYDKWALWQAPSDTTRYLANAAGTPVEDYLAQQRDAFRASFTGSETGAKSVKINRNANAYEAYFTTIYLTAPWFLVQLQDSVGTSAFQALMKDYYNAYRLKEATSADFLSVVRKHVRTPEAEVLIAKYF